MTLLESLKRFIPMARMIAPRHTSLPVLKRICFRDGHLVASDLDHHIMFQISTGGDYQIPIKTVADILKNKPETLSIREKKTDSGFEMLKIYFDGIIATIPASSGEFPALPRTRFKSLGAWSKDFVMMLEQQSPFVSKDELKPSLMGVLINIRDGVAELVATNGHFLRWMRNCNPGGGDHLAAVGDFTGLLSPKVIKFLAKFMGETVSVAGDGDSLRFTLDDCTLYYRLPDEKYPDYRRIIPTEFKGSAFFNRDEALKVARAIKQFCGPQKRVTISVTPNLAALTTKDPGTTTIGEGVFSLNSVNGEIVIGYNVDFLIKVLKSCGPTIQWKWDNPVHAAIFLEAEQEDVQVLLMPIRLND